MDSEAARGHVKPPPLPTKPPTVPPAEEGRAFRRIALLSWLLPLAGVTTFAIGQVVLVMQGRASGICAGVSILLFGSGILAGIVGLCGMARGGKRGILWPALAGIMVSTPLLVLGLINWLFTLVHNATLPPDVHLSPATHSTSARRLKDDQLQFVVDIPEGFQDFPEAKADPAITYAFIRRSADRKTACVITIERLNTTLSRTQRLTASQLPTAIQGQIILRKWRGVDIDVVVGTAMDRGVKTYLYQCMVPLRPKAIRVVVGECGPETDTEALSHLVDALLGSLDGETNW